MRRELSAIEIGCSVTTSELLIDGAVVVALFIKASTSRSSAATLESIGVLATGALATPASFASASTSAMIAARSN